MNPRSITFAAPRQAPCGGVDVLVAERDHRLREKVERAVRDRPGLRLLPSTSDTDNVVERIRALSPDVVVLDAAFGSAAVLAAAGPDTRMLLLAASEDPQAVYRALRAGAAGYLRRATPAEAVTDAVEAVARGRTVVDPALQPGLIEQLRQRTRT
jgi:two-component system, NarL family, nitrate/nitrite response regulator NarL